MMLFHKPVAPPEKTSAPPVDRPSLPPIDDEAPEVLETATFALG